MVTEMRSKGDGYGTISKAMGMSAGMVRRILQTQVLEMCPSPLPEIVVEVTPITKTSPTLAPARVAIRVSDDADDGPLAVARRSEPCTFDYIDSFNGSL